MSRQARMRIKPTLKTLLKLVSSIYDLFFATKARNSLQWKGDITPLLQDKEETKFNSRLLSIKIVKTTYRQEKAF